MNNCCSPKRKQNIFKNLFYKWRRYKDSKKPSRMEVWALAELKRLESTDNQTGDDMQHLVTKNVMDIVKLFVKQGYSRLSAYYTLNILTRILDWKPLQALTGEDDEWDEVQPWNEKEKLQQNKRCSSVFRNNFDNSTARYTNAKIFSDDGGRTWWYNRDSIISIVFPFNVPEKPEFVLIDQESDDEIK